jgi:hypothetical protein
LLFETERTGAVMTIFSTLILNVIKILFAGWRLSQLPCPTTRKLYSVKMTSWHTSEGFCFRDNQNGGNLHGQHLHVSFWGFSDQDTSFEHGKVVPKGAATLVRRKCHCTCDRIQWLFNVLAKMGEMLKVTKKHDEIWGDRIMICHCFIQGPISLKVGDPELWILWMSFRFVSPQGTQAVVIDDAHHQRCEDLQVQASFRLSNMTTWSIYVIDIHRHAVHANNFRTCQEKSILRNFWLLLIVTAVWGTVWP